MDFISIVIIGRVIHMVIPFRESNTKSIGVRSKPNKIHASKPHKTKAEEVELGESRNHLRFSKSNEKQVPREKRLEEKPSKVSLVNKVK